MKHYPIEGKEIFSHLTPKQISDISNAATYKNIEEGEIIFEQKQPAKDLFVLLEGEISLRIPGPKDMTMKTYSIEVDRIKDQGVFGPGVLFGVNRRMARAQAMKRSRIMFIDTRHFMKIIKENKSEYYILSYLAKVYYHRYINTMKELQQMMSKRELTETY